MQIALAHTNTDFDSLASQFAVTKLYPNARMAVGSPLAANLREFLTLYRDVLPIVDLRYIDLDKVTHVFVVDCQQAERLDEVGRKLITERHVPYTVFDHHALDAGGLAPGGDADSLVQPAGACTTLLVEKLMRRGVTLNALEATLLAIGIYEDSGCLTYGGTTSADAQCVAYLLAQGADLNQVSTFINPKLTDQQTELFQTLVNQSKSLVLSGVRVVLATAGCEKYIEGLATLTRRLLEVVSADAAITVVKMRDRVHIVGRSDVPELNLREVMREFGGDGHPGAASAVKKGESVEEVAAGVISSLQRHVHRQPTAAEIMRAPVRSIPPATTMEEAARIMLRYDEDGLVVVDAGEILGIVSRRDVDKALHHKLGHAPVRGFMGHPVVTVNMDAPFADVQSLMVDREIGRVPVVDSSGELKGIIGRRQLLQTMFGKRANVADTAGDANGAFAHLQERHIQFRSRMENLEPALHWLFKEIGLVAADLNMVSYAVGGCVRDMFLGSATFDLDFVIEGSAIAVGEALERAYPGRFEMAARHDRFQTATLIYHADKRREVDLSTARIEFYEHPAALPTVEPSRLEQDLFRRDFTINALAVCLNPDRYGDLVDFFDGVFDIEHKLIRVLHKFSFIEDPTRIIRAARFASRLGFELEPATRAQAQRAIAMGVFDDLGGFRLKTELRIILESAQRMKALELLNQLGGGLRYLAADLVYDDRLRHAMRRAERLLVRHPLRDEWIVYLAILLARLDEELLPQVMERLALANDEREWITTGLRLWRRLSEHAAGAPAEALKTEQPTRSKIYALLNGQPEHSLAVAASLATPGSPARRWIKLYLDELRHVQLFLSGNELIHLGFPQAPVLKEALESLRQAKLDGEVKTAAEELEFIRNRYPQYGTHS
jgi:tRNA nucleotidyltransferase (CCA-adding enzyme)